MRIKEKWAEEAKIQKCIDEDYPNYHNYHDDHYKIGWLAGFEFAKAQFEKDLSPYSGNSILDTRGVLIVLKRLGEEEI